MLTDLQDELVAYLESQREAGKHLEGFDLIQFSDAPPPAQFHRVVTVDWDNDFETLVSQSGIRMVARMAVTAYVSSRAGEKETDRILQDLLIRRVDSKWVGLIPALASVTGITTSGGSYFAKLLPNVTRGFVTDSARQKSRAGAILSLEFTTVVEPSEILLP